MVRLFRNSDIDISIEIFIFYVHACIAVMNLFAHLLSDEMYSMVAIRGIEK